MTQNKLEINRPSMVSTWTPEQMRAAVVRIHNRFQGLVLSIIESADWANYRLAEYPIEVGRPAWPEPGKYCDLVLQRRHSAASMALEIKTRHLKPADTRSDGEIADAVLDHMSSDLTKLQRLAQENDALWMVMIGLYSVPFQAAAINYSTPFRIVAVWGRDVGRDSPMGRARWSSLEELDRAICSAVDPVDFFTLAHLPRRPQPKVETSIEELIARSQLPHKMQRALLAVLQWPAQPTALRTFLRSFASEDCSEYAMRHYVLTLVELGIVRGYRKGERAHRLTIDEPRLLEYLLEADREQ